ncbi:MAG TPA: acetyl-CoA carboxylase biotin carboxylase subunit [Vicinamibacterales bacterium]|nr:acetyl-CoA carboxylase biotin carboxylase subunit [Vicinamibacterales bacterium]
MIRRLLIANRGEIAVRIIRACREMGVETVAVYSDADADAPHVRAADRAMAIGPPPAIQSYLAIPKILDAARHSGADAVHPGYGFLSENAAFARACADAGLTFVGPPPDAIEHMGSKIDARRLVSAAGVPVVPGETPHDQSDAGVRAAAERVGLPVLIKASAGGGGKGMRRVSDADALDESIQAARREAQAAFGDGTLYVERLVERPRHVEVQVFADAHGHTLHLFERECSVQRRHQKVIEESPSPVLTPALRARMTDAAVRAARAAGYRNAGTIEFLVHGDEFYFLEMNTRLQVEHPVTEQVVGVDLVRAQLLVAAGEPLPWTEAQLAQRGHAIEARVYAEDPASGFLPQAGELTRYVEPRRPGVRVDAGVAEGGTISVYYDPMIAKVIATAETRALAIDRLAAALREFVIEGVTTNIPFLLALVARDEFRRGEIDTAFLDREPLTVAPRPVADVATHESRASTRESGPLSYDPWDGGAVAKAKRSEAPKRRAASGAGANVTAPMPATVVKLLVSAGDAVKKGDTLLVLEAMKMELPIRAPGDATVKAVCCRAGEMVPPDAVLVEFDQA